MEITGSIAPAEGRESSDIVRGLFFCAVVPTSERTPWSNVSYVVWSATAYAEVSEWWIMDNRATPKQVPEPEMGISWARCELALSMIWKVFVKGAREVLGDGQGWSGCPKFVLGVNVGGRGRCQDAAMEIQGLPSSRWGCCDTRDVRVPGVIFDAVCISQRCSKP